MTWGTSEGNQRSCSKKCGNIFRACFLTFVVSIRDPSGSRSGPFLNIFNHWDPPCNMTWVGEERGARQHTDSTSSPF